MSDRSIRVIGLYAMIAAVASLVFAPLLALSYFATSDGAKELETASVSAWAEPARDVAGGLLTFASPDSVYAIYGLVFALLFPSVILCALTARSLRPRTQTRLELWGWRLTLPGYILFGLGLAALFVVLTGTGSTDGIGNILFLSSVIPGLLISLIGSTVLSIALLRSAYRPRLTAWLLALGVPLWIVGSGVLGHNSLGLVPLFVAWGLTGSRLWRTKTPGRAEAEAAQ